jgi:hypothetical protein
MNNIARSTLSPDELAAKWNRRFPIGTPVRYWIGSREGIGHISATRSEAEVLGGIAVVWIQSQGSCVAISCLEPIAGRAA